jgi:pyridoxal phosphate enzyme (YggS family)
MPELAAQIAENVAAVRGRIAAAAARSGRRGEQISLVAVTKYVGVAEVRALVEAGCSLLGESRPQELWEKAEALSELPLRWHLVGPLQRNKVRRTLPLVEMIESVDSPRLIVAIDRIAAELSLRMPVLLEVNASGEAAKHGFEPEAVERWLPEAARYTHVEFRGLMCMAGLEGGPEAARNDFRELRQLRDRLRPHCPEGITLAELSMGMSGDYEVAIEEGATIVRIGSALFRGVLG